MRPQEATEDVESAQSLSVNIPVSNNNSTAVPDDGLETPATTTARFLSKLSFPSNNTTTTEEDLAKLIEEDEKKIESEYLQRSGTQNTSRIPKTNTCAVCKLKIDESPISCSRSRCSRVYHLACLQPTLTERPTGRWTCPTCVATSAKSKKKTTKKKSTGSGARRRRCGRCEGCLRPQCGQCRNCLDKPCFGGKGTLKQACKLRVCENMKPANPSRRKKRSKNTSNKASTTTTKEEKTVVESDRPTEASSKVDEVAAVQV